MAMDNKNKKVRDWLEDIFGGSANVPEFEKTSGSFNVLHQLMLVSMQADSQAQALVQDHRVRVQEYAAKGAQKAAALQCVGLSVGDLRGEAQTALTELCQATVAVDAVEPTESQLMLGSTRLEARHDEVMRQTDAGDHLRSQLVSLSQLLAHKLQHAKMLEQQAEVALALELKERENNARRELFHEKKLAEYEGDIRSGEAELQHRGYVSSLTHDSVVRQWRRVQQLQQQVTSLQQQLQSYSLPPDVGAVRLEVERCRQQLAAIVSDMAAQQGQGFRS